MVLNHDLYKSLPNSKELIDTSPTFDDSSLDCAKSHGFSSQWTIYALSHAIGVNINVVYPPVNGKEDRPYKTFNVTCTPRNEDVELQRNISVMWSNVSPISQGIWTANHFVPLVSRMPLIGGDTSRNNFISDSMTDISFMSSPLDDKDLPLTSSPVKTGGDSDDDADVNTDEHDVPDKDTDVCTCKNDCTDDAKSYRHPDGTSNNGYFMGTEPLISLLRSETPSHKKLSSIPRGMKENVSFLVDNKENMKRERNGKNRKYVDDCGVWGKVSLKTHHRLTLTRSL